MDRDVLQDLYQEVILDHSRSPRHWGNLENPTHTAHGNNPLCGDTLILELSIIDNCVEDIAFKGCGCAISTASASLMSEQLKGLSVEAVQTLFDHFHTAVTDTASKPDESLGKLQVLTGVRAYPARVKCATLAWHTLFAALSGKTTPVTTE